MRLGSSLLARVSLVGALALTVVSCGSEDDDSSGSSPTPAPSTTTATDPASPTPSPATPSAPTAGAPGYGEVKLGMSSSELAKLGMTKDLDGAVVGPDEDHICQDVTLPNGVGKVTYDPRRDKVVAIGFEGSMTTSRGIRIGSTKAEVDAAYPDASFDAEFGYWRLPVRDDAGYLFFSSDEGATVSSILMAASDQGCFS